MTLHSLILSTGLIIAISQPSPGLVIAFPNKNLGPGFQLGGEVRTTSRMIGTIVKIQTLRNKKKVFVTVKLLPAVNIPTGSEFIFYNNVPDANNLAVPFSSQTTFINPKDTVTGVVKPVNF